MITKTVETTRAGVAGIWARDELLGTAPPKTLEVYPNPSTGYVILEYRLETASKGTIEIRDIAGQLMRSMPLDHIRDQVTVVCKDWKPGVYIASIKIANKLLDNVKFTLVK